MTQREYLKYNQQHYDLQNNLITIGAKCVINSYCSDTPTIGRVSHFTRNGKVAVNVPYTKSKYGYVNYKCYRKPITIIVLEDGNRTENKDKEES